MRWTPGRAMLVLVGCNLLWAGTYVAGKGALRALSPVELNCLRFGISGLTFVPIIWPVRHTIQLNRSSVIALARLCLLGFVLNKAIEFSGLRLTTASDTALLIASESLFTAIFGWFLLSEAVRGSAVTGLVLSLAGVYLVIERGLVLPQFGGGTRVLGDLMIVGALVFEALYTVLGKAELQRYSGIVITATCVIGSLTVWLPAAAVNVALKGWPQLDGGSLFGLFYLAIAGTTIAYIGWIVALRYVDAASAAPTLFLQPFFGTILAVALLHERLSWATAGGGALIILGILVVNQGQPSTQLSAETEMPL